MARPKAKSARESPPSAVDYRDLMRRLKLVADPTRLCILMLLGEGERNVAGIAAGVGQRRDVVSASLAVARRVSLVATRRDGTRVYCSLTDAGRALDRAAEGLGR